MTYDIQDFTVISTECDEQLFFSSKYQKTVTKIINNIISEYENNNPGFDVTKLLLICHSSCAELTDSLTEPNIYLFDIII